MRWRLRPTPGFATSIGPTWHSSTALTARHPQLARPLRHTDTKFQITAFKAAPDGEGLVEVLSAACLLFMWAADPFASAVNRPDITAQIKEQLQRFGTLPGAFPGEAPAPA